MSQLQIDRVVANGDCALTLYFVDSSNRSAKIHQLCRLLLKKRSAFGLCNVVPTVGDITLVFEQVVNEPQIMVKEVEDLMSELTLQSQQVTLHEIPVCYHPDVAADLGSVCHQLDLTVDELIGLHTQHIYQVSMLGFLPGFAYLDGNDKKMELVRKATPSLQVPKGSIAIAGKQTGIYALSSPGGWHVIGRTPKSMLDWDHRYNTMLLSPLDQVKFKAITLSTFQSSS